MEVLIDGSKLNTKERQDKALLVQAEMKRVLNHENFKENLLYLLRTRNYAEGELSEWRHHSPESIYEYLMDGSEILHPEKDGVLNLWVDDYYSFKKVIGYTTRSDDYIYSNTKYLDHRSAKMVGSNYVHEWGHKKGFSHDFRSTSRRRNSLCYLLNIAYETTWDDLYTGDVVPEADKIKVCTRTWYTLWLGKKCKWVMV